MKEDHEGGNALGRQKNDICTTLFVPNQKGYS